MSKRIETFADLIAPVGEDEFFAEYHDRKPLHIKAPAPDKLDDVMSWDALNAVLNMTAIWSPKNLKLVLDTDTIPAEQYCREAVDRNGMAALQPDAGMIKDWLRRGASIVANDIDTLTPGMISAADALERRLGGKAQSNLYCSWYQHQAFPTHMDTHEVFALHVAGEKVWRLYEGRLENPIANAEFKARSDEFHREQAGKVAQEVTLRPGDILYIPRGQYHDALASSDGCIHLAFGVTHVIGYDAMMIMFERALTEPMFRQNVPFDDDGAARAWIGKMGARLAEIAESDEVWAAFQKFRRGFGYPRGGFNLPGDAVRTEAQETFRVALSGLTIATIEGRAVLQSEKQRVPVPPEFVRPMSWILDRGAFTRGELHGAFPETAPEAHNKLVQDLINMKVLAAA